MKRKMISIAMSFAMLIGIVGCVGTLGAFAEENQLDGFIYEVRYEEVHIKGYNGKDSKITIPTEIEGVSVRAIDSESKWSDTVKDVVIPNGVKTIMLGAFSNSSIETISLPESLESIGEFAFENCVNLSTVSIPENVKYLQSNLFKGCSKLSEINLPDTITNIDASVFDGTAYYDNADNWADGALYIGNYLFDAKNVAGDYVIKDGTRVIATNAFSNNQELKSVVFPKSLVRIGTSAFENCGNISEVNIPSAESIGYAAFLNCENLEKISLSDNIAEVDEAFENTKYYNDENNWNNGYLYIDNVLIVGNKKDENVEIDPKTRAIASSAFEYSDVKSIKLPDGLKSIGHDAFYYCKQLSGISIPSSVEFIGNSAFNYCESIKSITIPSKVKQVGIDSFGNCESLEELTFNYGLEKISDEAFCGCNSLKKVTLPNSLKSIGSFAFNSCQNLKEAYIPDSVKSIGYNILGCCDDDLVAKVVKNSYADKMMMHQGIKREFVQKVLFDYEELEDGTLRVIGYNGDEENVKIPYMANCKVISSIANGILDKCKSLKTVTIKDNVTDIPTDLFKNINDVCIYTYENSSAAEFAADNGIKYEIIDVNYGDVNDDDTINMKDVLSLRKFIAGIKTDYEPYSIDCNGDESINMKDVLILRKFLAGWDVVLGK